jgi:large subunit ribosomal protein L17
MPAPKKGPRFGGSPSHQKLMLANMAAHLFASEGMVTTEAKAKALRPLAEHLIPKAKTGGLHQKRQVMAVITARDETATLFSDIGPRYAERHGGYLRILKLGPRPGDSAPMARIELV